MVRLGLVGCGYWGKNHLRTLREIGEDCLKTVCDSKQPKITIPRGVEFTNDLQVLIDDPHIRGVVIATPTATHYQLAKCFLEAGKGVLVEKPLTANVSEAQRLCEIAESNGQVLMVGEIFRFNSALYHVKQIIDRGEIGDLRYLESRRVGLGPVRNDVSALLDLATHDIYISNLIVGKVPRSVSYQGISHNGCLDDISTVNLKFSDPNVLATIYVNWEHPVKERRLIIGGTKKAILFDDVEPSEKIKIYNRGVDYQPDSGDFGDFQASTRDGDIHIPNIRLTQPLEQELRHYIACLEGKAECVSNGYKGLETVRVLEAAEDSRRSQGLEVRL